MNLQKYVVFVKVAECGSFTKAAQLLNYSQSSVSRMISDLEKEWKINLFERSSSKIKLTSDGIKLIPYAESIVNEFTKLKMEVDEINGLNSGLIRIGTFSSVATHWLPNIIKEFQKDYPNIEYELLLGDYKEIENWILTGRVDCGFLKTPTNSEFKKIFLEDDMLMVIIPENHKFKNIEKISIKDLYNENFILLDKGDNSEVIDILKKTDMQPNIRFTTWDDYAIMSMVEANLGISILPKLILKRIPYNVIMKELDFTAYRRIIFATRDNVPESVVVKKFMEYLKYR